MGEEWANSLRSAQLTFSETRLQLVDSRTLLKHVQTALCKDGFKAIVKTIICFLIPKPVMDEVREQCHLRVKKVARPPVRRTRLLSTRNWIPAWALAQQILPRVPLNTARAGDNRTWVQHLMEGFNAIKQKGTV